MVEKILEHVAESAAVHILRHTYWQLRFIQCSLIRPTTDIRVSFSALALISDGGHYLLVRNLHRPESFAPFGGVYKYKDSTTLEHLEFKPQSFHPPDDMRNDLRGFLPRRNLARLIAWFKKKKERETAEECLTRELAEEIREARLNRTTRCPDFIPLRLVRRVQEGPEKVPGQAYTQYRIFNVYKIDESKPFAKRFKANLLAEARRGQKNLMLATAEEIVSGRGPSGHLIGSHAGYLFTKKRVRPDIPIFNNSAAPSVPT